MKKIIALVLALAMLTLTLVACGSGGTTKVQINFTVSIVANGETILNSYEHQIKASETKIPTVLVASLDALSSAGILYDADETQFTSVTINGTKYSMGQDDSNIYAWIYKVNGSEPKEGKMTTNLIEDGQNITFELISIPIEKTTNNDAE